MIESLAPHLARLEDDVRVVIQSGATPRTDAVERAEWHAFIPRKSVDGYFSRASLVISHCGIGSIYSAREYARPLILFVRQKAFGEFSDDHQAQIAKEVRTNKHTALWSETEQSLRTLLDFVALGDRTRGTRVDLVNHEVAAKVASQL